MTAAVDRTGDFVQSVQAFRSNQNTKQGLVDLSVTQNSALDRNAEHTKLLRNTVTSSAMPQLVAHNRRNGTLPIHKRSEFAQMASTIGRDLASTFGKLEQLNALARRQSLFDDHGAEIQQLTYIIKEDMAALNQRIAQLQAISKSRDSDGQQQATHSHSVLMGLQTRLAKMSNQFRGMLEQRSECLRTQAARRGKYTTMNNQSPDLIRAEKPQHTIIPSVLLRDDERARQEAQDDSQHPNRHSRPDQEPEVRVAQQLSLLDQTDTYLASRADTMQSIEHTIVELGVIFQQLATMVHEQDESIHRIDSNVDDAALSIEAGHTELVRYLRSISSNRWLMFKVFGVLLIFFIIFVVFFV